MRRTEIPVDVLEVILAYLDQPDLAAVCLVNTVCCAYARNVLYHNLTLRTAMGLYTTLVQYPDLARRVQSCTVCDVNSDYMLPLSEALCNMSSLRTLKLNFSGSHSWILTGCYFKLRAFSCSLSFDSSLQAFLERQPDLTNVTFVAFDSPPRFESSFLPNISRIAAPWSWVQQLILNRPVSDVTILVLNFDEHFSEFFNINFLSLPATPIKKLRIDDFYLHGKSVELIASTLPSLAHLTIRTTFDGYVSDLSGVCAPLQLWVESLLSALSSIQTFRIRLETNLTEMENIPPADAYLLLVKTMSGRSPHLQHFDLMFTNHPEASHCWSRIGGQWVICDRC